MERLDGSLRFVWGLEQKALHQVQAAVQTALPLEQYDSVDPMVLRYQWKLGMLSGAFGRPL